MKRIVMARAVKTQVKPGPRKRFAVYIRPPAMKPDVHCVTVGVDGDRAFAYEPGAKRALIIASSAVFDKREDAERYLAGTGPFKWCVANVYQGELSEDETGYIMFEARVVEKRNPRNRFGGFEKLITARYPDLDEKVRRNYSLEVFDTKREAVKYLRDKVCLELESATKEASQWASRKATLARMARSL